MTLSPTFHYGGDTVTCHSLMSEVGCPSVTVTHSSAIGVSDTVTCHSSSSGFPSVTVTHSPLWGDTVTLQSSVSSGGVPVTHSPLWGDTVTHHTHHMGCDPPRGVSVFLSLTAQHGGDTVTPSLPGDPTCSSLVPVPIRAQCPCSHHTPMLLSHPGVPLKLFQCPHHTQVSLLS